MLDRFDLDRPRVRRRHDGRPHPGLRRVLDVGSPSRTIRRGERRSHPTTTMYSTSPRGPSTRSSTCSPRRCTRGSSSGSRARSIPTRRVRVLRFPTRVSCARRARGALGRRPVPLGSGAGALRPARRLLRQRRSTPRALRRRALLPHGFLPVRGPAGPQPRHALGARGPASAAGRELRASLARPRRQRRGARLPRSRAT